MNKVKNVDEQIKQLIDCKNCCLKKYGKLDEKTKEQLQQLGNNLKLFEDPMLNMQRDLKEIKTRVSLLTVIHSNELAAFKVSGK